MGIGIGNPEEQTIIKKERNYRNTQKFFINMNM